MACRKWSDFQQVLHSFADVPWRGDNFKVVALLCHVKQLLIKQITNILKIYYSGNSPFEGLVED